MIKAVLEVILVLLKVLRELFGLLRDKKNSHRQPQIDEWECKPLI